MNLKQKETVKELLSDIMDYVHDHYTFKAAGLFFSQLGEAYNSLCSDDGSTDYLDIVTILIKSKNYLGKNQMLLNRVDDMFKYLESQ